MLVAEEGAVSVRRPPARAAALGTAALGAAAALTVLSVLPGSRAAGGPPGTALTVVAFSQAEPAVRALGAAFAATPEGTGTTVAGSYGASGAQSRAIVAGQPADLVMLSLAPDIDRLVRAGLVAPGWDAGPTRGMVADSVVVIAVRPGNPRRIHGWADLVRPGIRVVTADPGSSGAAKWNLLAAYAQALGGHRDTAAARSYLARFVAHVASWNDSGRSATEAFLRGGGDALVCTESEAIAARAAGLPLDYLLPRTTLLVQDPAAVTVAAPARAARLLTFLHTAAGRRILSAAGFRPVDPAPGAPLAPPAGPVPGALDPAHPFPQVPDLITLTELGGWPAVDASLFAPDTGLLSVLRNR